jgi:hypothetical protein
MLVSLFEVAGQALLAPPPSVNAVRAAAYEPTRKRIRKQLLSVRETGWSRRASGGVGGVAPAHSANLLSNQATTPSGRT